MAHVIQQLPQVDQLVTRYLGSDSLWEVDLHAANSRAVLPGIIDSINQNGTHLVNMRVVEPSLEDVFIQLTGKALRD
jgi:ABC-2 type transport system ATP-binding protein